MNASTGNTAVVPAPRDHFLNNVLWVEGMNTEHLWVYATDASGVPQPQPVQKLVRGQFGVAASGRSQ
jgi:hypothetical protein